MYESVVCASGLCPNKAREFVRDTCKYKQNTCMFSMLRCNFYGSNSVMWGVVKGAK